MSLEFAQSLLLDLHRSQLAEGDQLIDRRLGLSGLADSAGRDDDTISGALDATVHGQSLPLVDFDSSDAPTTLDAATLEAAKRERNSN
jgi:hypothetical protein